MKKLKIVVKRNALDRVVEVLTLIAVFVSFLFPIIYYSELPEQIPMHFNSSGSPDRIGSRNSIWILPILAAVLCLGINRIIRFPHLFNYPVKITEENAADNYRMAQRTLRIINLIVGGSIAYITWKIILTSLGRSEGLSLEFLIVFSILILGTPLFFMWKLRRMRSKKES